MQGDPQLGSPGRREFVKGGPSMFSGESVRVTVEEAAALQTFPPGYPWRGTKTAQYQQIGNAVPPLLARHVLAAAAGISVAEVHTEGCAGPGGTTQEWSTRRRRKAS